MDYSFCAVASSPGLAMTGIFWGKYLQASFLKSLKGFCCTTTKLELRVQPISKYFNRVRSRSLSLTCGMMNPSATMSPMISSDGSERISLNSRLGLPLCVKTTIYPLSYLPRCIHFQGLTYKNLLLQLGQTKVIKRLFW